MQRIFVIFLFVGFLTLTACLPSQTILPTETPQPSETALPTSTVIWFPPSATSTLLAFPTYTGTPEMSPGIGAEILSDDFSDDSNWDTATSDQGSANISRNRLSLFAQPGITLTSMNRIALLTDFYAEITVNLSLCRGEDSYGLIVRSQGNSFYRFSLACNSMIQAERIKSNVRLGLQQPVPSGDAPAGAPGEVHIGLWAVGGEMRLFLNGRFQFSVTDIAFSSGGFGVFARGGGDTPVSVIFSDFVVYDVSYTVPTKTPMP
ncbi:MAG: hypothetical protein IPP66_10735 [Anaerolineales bacterium]|nr:hypothetical protein [Anaerolineales bacterium]